MVGLMEDKKREIDSVVFEIMNVSDKSRLDCSDESHMYSVKGVEKISSRPVMLFATHYFDGEINPFVLEIVVDEPRIENYSDFSFSTVDALIHNVKDKLALRCTQQTKLSALLSRLQRQIDHFFLH